MSISTELLYTPWRHGIIAICQPDHPDCKGFVELGWHLPISKSPHLNFPPDRERKRKVHHTLRLYFKITNLEKDMGGDLEERREQLKRPLGMHVVSCMSQVGDSNNLSVLSYNWL